MRPFDSVGYAAMASAGIYISYQRVMNKAKNGKKEFRLKVIEIKTSPLIDFVDYKKLMLSPLIMEMCDFSLDHMMKHNDSVNIATVLSIFEKSKYFSTLLSWFCDTASLTYEVADGVIALKKTKNNSVVKSTLENYLGKHGIGSNLVNIIKTKKDAAPKSIRKKSIDLMDSRLMYAGGYGTGKRR